MTLHEHVTTARARLGGAGIAQAEAGLDAEVLARHVLCWDRATFVVHRHDIAPASFANMYEELIVRREAREPVARIRGSQEFWGLELEVTPATLVPRPETELIIEQLLAVRDTLRRPTTVVDVGTGTGCLAIAVARELPGARVIATDLSPAALEVARRNAVRHGLAGPIAFVRADLLEGLVPDIDVVVSNPPYVPTPIVPSLAPEVSDHEPAAALVGGLDGLDVIRRLIHQAATYLRPGGRLLFEFGAVQLEAIEGEIDRTTGLGITTVTPDLQGIPRVAVVERQRRTTGPRVAEFR